MKIAIIGAGYVGLTAAAVYAKLGHVVYVLEKNASKVSGLQRGVVPFFEPGLKELVSEDVRNKKLFFSLNYSKTVREAEIIFICVGTPTKKSGESDLSQVFECAEEIGKNLNKKTVIVNKSTVPVGTTEKVAAIIGKAIDSRFRGNDKIKFEVASCPEFLREGSAVENTLRPDRIIIGVDSSHAKNLLLEVHKKLPGKRVITDIRTAEMIKYASNAFLATKISFINEIANLCEELGANVDDVASAMGLDPRIGKGFLQAGIGYGGSCFPKDTSALHFIARSHNYKFKLLKAVIEVNQFQRDKFFNKIAKTLGGLKSKKIGVLGLAFKNNTDDVRESAAMEIISKLLNAGAKIKAYDPKAMANAKKAVQTRYVASVRFVNKPAGAVKDSDALLILTEWPEFKKLPWEKFVKLMKRPVVLDGRNLLNPEEMRNLRYKYISIGRP